jgi:uncharacterized protein YkwD
MASMLVWALQLGMLIVLVWSGYIGYRRGLLGVAIEAGGLVTASVISLCLAAPVAGALDRLLPGGQGHYLWSLILAWVLGQAIWFGAWWPHLRRMSHHKPEALWLRTTGATTNVLKTAVILVVVLSTIRSLPLPQQVKSGLVKGPLSGLALVVAHPWQQAITEQSDRQLSRALGFMAGGSVDQEFIDLGYTDSSGRSDEPSEASMLVLLNQERISRGLGALRMDPTLVLVARKHSQDMLMRGYFSHMTPEGTDPFARLRAEGVSYLVAGENLALAPSVVSAHQGLMSSPKHRDNILGVDYGHVGVGIIHSQTHGYMVSQEFTQ